MKRLQFRHYREVFQNREDVLKYFADIVDVTNTASTIFKSSLYAEPLVAKYRDEDGNVQVIFAIGVDSGLTPYHIIDSKDIYNRLDANEKSIDDEVIRAIAAEAVLSGAVINERSERIESDDKLQKQITDNISKLHKVNPIEENVFEEFVLKNALDEELGEHIKIYKDNSLVGAEVSYKGATGVTIDERGELIFAYSDDMDKEHEYLYLVYRNEIGELSLVGLDFENFLMETEEGKGIKIIDHKIGIRIKDDEKYLDVTDDGLHTKNIDDAISGAVETLRKEVDSNRIYSKDLIVKKETNGTTLEIQTDEVTITKLASASTIYDTNVAVLGSLLKIKKVESTNPAVKVVYQLQDGNDNVIGDSIELPVESALISVKQGNVGDAIDPSTGNYITNGSGDTTMNFVYRLEDGTFELMQVVVSEYFTDSHFGRGLNNQDGTVSLLEGDGNEYLVIGEDTIAVVGVNDAINNAKAEANAYTDEKALSIKTEGNEYTDNRINDLTSSIESLTDTLSSSIEGVRASVDAETLNRETADADIIRQISEEAGIRSQADADIYVKISQLESADSALDTQINTVKEAVISKLTDDFTKADNNVYESGKTYTDNAIQNAVDVINGKKVNDVAYDNGNKKIYLTFADGTMSTGFDASEFVVDGMLNSVSFNNATNEIIFKWNTDAGISELIVPLDKFVDQYKVANDSVSYLKISDDNNISAIVDGSDGYANTLATTDFVKNEDKVLSDKIEEAKESIATTNDNITILSGNVENRIIDLDGRIEANAEAIGTLSGSVNNTINSVLQEALITEGAPASDITLDEAKGIHSLIRKIKVDGEIMYFVIDEASSMRYLTEEGTYENLNNYITSLKNRIVVLESIYNNLDSYIKNVIKSYITGTTNEIKVSMSETEDKLKIGFENNAIFGEV